MIKRILQENNELMEKLANDDKLFITFITAICIRMCVYNKSDGMRVHTNINNGIVETDINLDFKIKGLLKNE